MKISGQKDLTVLKGGQLQAKGAGAPGAGERSAEGAPHRGQQTRDSARSGAASPPSAGLTPEQGERLGFGDQHQGVHSGQVEQAHQDDVPPNDVLPLLACARPLLTAAALRVLDPRAAFLRGAAEGDLAPIGGPARHGCREVGAGDRAAGSRALRAGISPVGAGASA